MEAMKEQSEQAKQSWEEWKLVVDRRTGQDFSHYKVSNFGRILSPTGRIMKTYVTKHGYEKVGLSNGKETVFGVHKLVAWAFVPNPDNKPTINHIDCNRSNNHSSNLEWCTQSENLKYAFLLGRVKPPSQQGKRWKNRIINELQPPKKDL